MSFFRKAVKTISITFIPVPENLCKSNNDNKISYFYIFIDTFQVLVIAANI